MAFYSGFAAAARLLLANPRLRLSQTNARRPEPLFCCRHALKAAGYSMHASARAQNSGEVNALTK